jgi:hypothetical protein
MFDAYCPDHRSRVLLTARQILELEPGPGRTTVRARCWCGGLAIAEFHRRVAR